MTTCSEHKRIDRGFSSWKVPAPTTVSNLNLIDLKLYESTNREYSNQDTLMPVAQNDFASRKASMHTCGFSCRWVWCFVKYKLYISTALPLIKRRRVEKSSRVVCPTAVRDSVSSWQLKLEARSWKERLQAICLESKYVQQEMLTWFVDLSSNIVGTIQSSTAAAKTKFCTLKFCGKHEYLKQTQPVQLKFSIT